MSPTETTTILRQFNEWRRGEGEDLQMPKPREIGKVIDAAVEMIDRLEAAEKERDALRAEVIHIKEVEFPRKAQAVADGWRGKCERLEAKIEAMERQGPVGKFIRHPSNGLWEQDGYGDNPDARPLYALPGAQNVASSQDEWKTLAKDLLREIERQTCAHEETHRGGFLWEICDSCGAKWADDEGGKPEFKWPKVVERAHAMLAAAPEAKP